jgi:hypothetical protein
VSMAWKRRKKPQMVPEIGAPGEVQAIYTEIRNTLRVPQIDIFFEIFAGYPGFLPAFWESARPVVKTAEFFEFAQRTGAEAYTRVHSYLTVPALGMRGKPGEEARQAISRVCDLFQYSNPVLLLLSATLLHGLESSGRGGLQGRTPRETSIPEAPLIILEEEASPAIRKIYDDVRRTLETPFLTCDMRALANWPDFLKEYWGALKPSLSGPVYRQTRAALRETAWSFAGELPGRMELSTGRLEELGMEEDEITEVVRSADGMLNVYSGASLNIAFAKIGLEGGNRRSEKEPAA